MPELDFRIEGAESDRSAAVPLLRFKLRIDESTSAAIHTAILSCQIRIEPARRRYSPAEQARLVDLFGTPERWGQTLRPMPWTTANATVRGFELSTTIDLPVPCSYDFSLAATKYFDALEAGEIPLCFLFTGTVFYQGGHGGLLVAQVPWDKEAYFRLPAETWRSLMALHYPNGAWLCLRKDVFDRLGVYKSRRGLGSWEQAVEALLESQREAALS
jgi:Family of unknown function (DUF6084)